MEALKCCKYSNKKALLCSKYALEREYDYTRKANKNFPKTA